ncbi:amino acid ABC transporter substrate-binding protein [Philodulcilactobacillus myokoensis]|uniref:Amino acid ABC transporter substrate-binding protein n=1 Tax=Philodulcilactobacillus myokoensis TaxID=2929573 RepID=A0A9W6AZX3_9LACO|nr:transporter substrate-binding domain-containing protein [Philodulcilactobacillus myokoensis]GLB46317.1 amino acid ABC transporter substrate-binding protein [Philodulcilactobacillus myokoensis]
MKFGKKFRRIAALVAVLSVGLVLTACGSSKSSNAELQHKGKLTVGLEGTYAPYSYRQNGKLTGFEVELTQDIAKKMHLKPQYVTTKWDGLIAGLGSNKYDTVFNNIGENPQRKKSFLFSTPYIYDKSIIITKTSDKSIQNLKSIKGKKFVEGTGTNNEALAKQYGASIVPSEEFTTSLALIKEGRADGAVNSLAAWNAYKKDHSTAGLKAIVIPKSEHAPAKIAGLFNKQSPALRKKVSKAIKQLRKDGTLKKLSEKYFQADVTKND